MAKRKIIKIDEQNCNGCALCMPNCPEGAIQIIDKKARLVSDLFCDGLGACIGYCPQGAIAIEEREAEKYDERKVMANVVRQGKNVIKAHLEHLKAHKLEQYLKEAMDFLKEKKIEITLVEETPPATHEHVVSFECPGSKMIDFRKKEYKSAEGYTTKDKAESHLRQWPVQIMLVGDNAPYFNNAEVLISADCVPFTYADFHRDLLKGKVLLVGCPKLDDISVYKEKISRIINNNHLKSITYAHMEVPCCFGLINIIQDAISSSGKDIPFEEITISIKGEKLK
jgi:Fe-S-cluster-containing hydrogenase component 2